MSAKDALNRASFFVLNFPTMPTVTLTANLRFTAHQLGHARRETHGGIEYLIAPVTAIVAGVLNGRLVSSEVIEESVWSWPDVPVVLPHPQKNGVFVSARSPEWAATTPARLYNTFFEDNALKGEVWINLEMAHALGGDTWEMVERIEAGELIECSTGYYADEVRSPGVWNGEGYDFITTAIYPDHLAVLLHEVGACSVADGCGVLANTEGSMSKLILNDKSKPAPCPDGERLVEVNLEISLSAQEGLVYDAWWMGNNSGRIIAVYPDRVDVVNMDGLWAYPYGIDDQAVVTFGDPQQYTLTANERSFFSSLFTNLIHTFRADKEVSVKDQFIARIVANKRNKLSKEQLATLDEPTLKALSESLEAETPNGPHLREAAPPVETPPPAPAPPDDAPPAWAATLVETVEVQGQLIQQLAGQLTANAAIARQPLVDFIVANTQLYTAETLAGMETEGLEKIYQLVAQATGQQVEPVVPNFIGLGGRLGTNASKEGEIAKPPSLFEAIQEQRNGKN